MTYATKFAATTAVALALSTSSALADFLQLENLSASWGPTVGGTSVNYDGNGTDNPFIAWGTPVITGDSVDHGGIIGFGSGYELSIPLDPVPDPAVAPDGASFDFGTFTHFNNPISAGTAITSTQLQLIADVTLRSPELTDPPVTIVDDATFTFNFEHNETPNVAGNCPEDAIPCDDIVTVTLLNDTSSVVVDGVEYTLTFLGFRQDGVLNEQFISPEGGFSPGVIEAQFTATEIPAPATVLLLGTGLLGLSAVQRRKKAA